MLEKGLVEIYTGDGKGKTTAGYGLALRAAGHGNRVLIYQFLKPDGLDSGERKSMARIEEVTVKVLDEPWDMTRSLDDAEAVGRMREKIHEALAKIAAFAQDRVYDVIILDEIVFCVKNELASLDEISKLVERKHRKVELVMTGRGAEEELIALADLVTEMKEVKHPYSNGVRSRKGIEY
ncbi:MAG: cob(I)yrinic acid a,c-diamide adenosyltransferase [Planctomycetes bacterium]|nr:cob(I)yrinic acid a,c-diamide adenosyltransferase [Planctomycetota bacterium]